eukprot:6187520-Pleurochrysis_carterae.AAC.1
MAAEAGREGGVRGTRLRSARTSTAGGARGPTSRSRAAATCASPSCWSEAGDVAAGARARARVRAHARVVYE